MLVAAAAVGTWAVLDSRADSQRREAVAAADRERSRQEQNDLQHERAVLSDLRNAAVGQEVVFSDTGSYASDIDDLAHVTSDGVQLRVYHGNVRRYCLEARHEDLPGRTFVLNSENGVAQEGTCSGGGLGDASAREDTLSELRNLAVVQEQYFSDNGRYPDDWWDLDVRSLDEIAVSVAFADNRGYCLAATHEDLPGRTFVLDSKNGIAQEGTCLRGD